MQKGRPRTAGERQPCADGVAAASRHRPVAAWRKTPQLALAGDGAKEKTAVGEPCVCVSTTWGRRKAVRGGARRFRGGDRWHQRPLRTGAPHHAPSPASRTRPDGDTPGAASSPSGVKAIACEGAEPSAAQDAPTTRICPGSSVPVPHARSAVAQRPREVRSTPPLGAKSCEAKKSPGVCPLRHGARASGGSLVTTEPPAVRQRPEASLRSCAEAAVPTTVKGDAMAS